LKSTLAMLPSRAWATNTEYGMAAAEGLPKGKNRMMFQTRRTARKIRAITQRENRGRPVPPPLPSPGVPGAGGSGGRSRAGGDTGPSLRARSDPSVGGVDPVILRLLTCPWPARPSGDRRC
jgi:hypothetical protein